jgi:hypothetical protein
MADTWTHERATFRERIARLAGKTSWREPVAGYTNKTGELGEEQQIAMALAFARDGADDIGPEVAYCLICETRRGKPDVLHKVTQALRKQFPKADARPLMTRQAVNQAFEWAVFGIEPDPEERPKAGMAPETFWGLVLVSRGVIIRAGEEAIYRAERAFYGRAA